MFVTFVSFVISERCSWEHSVCVLGGEVEGEFALFSRGGWNSTPQVEKAFYPSRGLQALVELFCEVTRTLKQSGGGVFTVRVAKAVVLLHAQRWW